MAATVSFTFSPAEDRIVVVVPQQAGAGATVLLTRRMVRQVIARLAYLLDRSSPFAQRAPASMRDEVVLLEHQSAVAQLNANSDAGAEKAPVEAAVTATPALLILRADLTPQPPGFLLVLAGAAGQNVALNLQWQDLHRLVGALHRLAQSAQWDLAEAAPWLVLTAGTTPASA